MSVENAPPDRDVARGEAAYAVLRQVRPLHQLSARTVADALTDSPVTVAMRAIMERLVDGGPQTVPQIARSLWIARQGVQRVVDEALSAGFVQRRPNPDHARSRLIALTDRGRAEFEALHRAELVMLQERLSGVSVAALREAADVLARFADAIGAGEASVDGVAAEAAVAAADRGE